MERSRSLRETSQPAPDNAAKFDLIANLLGNYDEERDNAQDVIDQIGEIVFGDAFTAPEPDATRIEEKREFAQREAAQERAAFAAGMAADTPDEALTDQQRVGEFLQQLEADGKANSFHESLLDQLRRRGSLSDKQVLAVMRDIEKAERTQQVAANAEALGVPRQQGKPAVTEPGVYEKDGVVYVVKFNKEKTSLYAKRIRELNSTRITEAGTVVEIEFDYVAGAVYKLAPEDKMPLDKAKEYTIRYGRCIVCGRFLKKAESVERGIGPVCIKSFS